MSRFWHTWIESLPRIALLCGVGVVTHRYLAELVPVWMVLAGAAVGAATTVVLRRRRPPVIALGLVGVQAGATGVALLVLWVGAAVAADSVWWEELLVLFPWRVLPAVMLATVLLLWDLWVRRSAVGRMLFPPVYVLAVVLLFWTQAEFRTDLLGHPSWYAVSATLATVFLLAHQRLSGAGIPQAVGRRRRKDALLLAVVVIALLVSVGAAFRGWQNQAVEAGGGLLRPTALRFDFADYVQLEPEIRQTRDLVFLYREAHPPPDRLLRRYVLSGYDRRRGFYRLEQGAEPAAVPPLSVDRAAGNPDRSPGPAPQAPTVEQELYLVNFDPDALIAVAEPQQVTRLSIDAGGSFNAAYRVSSERAVFGPAGPRAVTWPRELPDDWEVYLDQAVSPAVADLAEEITGAATGYHDTVKAVVDHLRTEYYYSLNPGEAIDGSQLEHFLFTSRKGYCSYFAFSATLMLRHLGIPSRVAVGFFVDPRTGLFGFHPVRGDMAHAWVEVWYPGVGWVEFDPTSDTVAPGEIVATDYNIDQEELSALVQEILDTPGDEVVEPGAAGAADSAVGGIAGRRRGIAIGAGLLLAAFVAYRRARWFRVKHRSPEQAILLRWRQSSRLVVLLAPGLDVQPPVELSEMVDRARFGPPRDRAEVLDDLNRSEVLLRRWRAATVRLMSPLRLAVLGWTRALPLVFVPSPRRRGRFFRGFLLLILIAPVASPQLPDPGQQVDAEELLMEARRAVDQENYEAALRRLKQGQRWYPEDHRFLLETGDLYFDQRLYELAERAYRTALDRGAPGYSAQYMLSRSLSRLNRDREAAELLAALHQRYPDDRTVVGDLAWLYFKAHRLEEARTLLEENLATYGPDRDLSMTLATVYSGLWDYRGAEQTYDEAIQDAQSTGDRIFLAVAYYNLSILHANFYRHRDARNAAERSIEAAERASGYMIRGELKEMELQVADAAQDYHRAAVLDEESPLADVSLAALWTDAGFPEQARARLERIRAEDQRNWMYNYGTDPVRFQQQLYRALADAYEAQAAFLRLHRPGTVAERFFSRFRTWFAAARGWYYRGLERRQTLRVADNYAEQGRDLLAHWNRMRAAEGWPRLALRHAAAAQAVEVVFNPAAATDYRLFRAEISHDAATLESLLPELAEPWRRADLATALRGVYRHRGPADRRGRSAAARAWVLEPGAFLVHGLRVPVSLGVTGASSPGNEARLLRRLGFDVVDESPLHLELIWTEETVEYRMVSRELNRAVRYGSVRYGADRRGPQRALEELARTLLQADPIVLGNAGATSTADSPRR